ncbi:integrase core domain-containing protein [Desulfovibrio sp.]
MCFANCHIRLAFCDTPLIFNKAKNEDNWGIEYNEQRPHESLGNLTP